MDAKAWGAFRSGMDHLLAEAEKLQFEPLAADGSVSAKFRTDRPFGVGGEYDVLLTFTASEIDEFYRRSIAGMVSGLSNKKSP